MAVSVLLYLMLLGAVQFSQQFDQNMGASSGSNIVLAIVVLRTAVWILGTIATIVFIFKGHKNDASKEA
jgi:nitric oxide reductase large subunit